MAKTLLARFALMAAISNPAYASDPAILFHVERNGHVFIDCLGVDYADVASVKTRLEELKRWNPHALVDFFVDDGAPADVASTYRKLVVSEGFRFGKSSGFCP
jgi:hypothetical protein